MFISGHDPEDKTVHVGASPVYFMPDPAAKAYYVSYGAEGAAAISKSLDDLQAMMATLGARILQPEKRAVETAETAQIHRQGEISVLANIAHGINLNLTQALQLMLTWALYEDVDDAKIELSTDFVPVQTQPQLLAEMVKAWQAGAISHDSLWTFAQGGELVDARRTAEEERELIRDEDAEEPPPVPGTVIGPDGTPIPPQPAPALVPARGAARAGRGGVTTLPISKKANTPKRKRMWKHVEKSAKARGASAGSAVRQANAAVKRDKARKRRKRK